MFIFGNITGARQGFAQEETNKGKQTFFFKIKQFVKQKMCKLFGINFFFYGYAFTYFFIGMYFVPYFPKATNNSSSSVGTCGLGVKNTNWNV